MYMQHFKIIGDWDNGSGVCFIDCKLCAVEHIDVAMDTSIPYRTVAIFIQIIRSADDRHANGQYTDNTNSLGLFLPLTLGFSFPFVLNSFCSPFCPRDGVAEMQYPQTIRSIQHSNNANSFWCVYHKHTKMMIINVPCLLSGFKWCLNKR